MTTVQAETAPGAGAEAMALGIEISDMYARLTGHTPMFGRAVTGTFAGLSWITSFPDLAALEAANAAVGTDAGWQELLGRAGSCYLPGATTAMLRRLA